MILFDKCLIVACGDGCGWGQQSKTASYKAVNKFCNYMNVLRREMVSTYMAGKLILRGFEMAHRSIIEDIPEDEIYERGTTTLLGGILLELDQSEVCMVKPYFFLFGNLGDC